MTIIYLHQPVTPAARTYLVRTVLCRTFLVREGPVLTA